MKNNSRITRRTNPLLVFLLTFLVSSYGYSQTATAPMGSGTSGSPYLIGSLENLYWITQNTSSWGAYFEQTADIDASATVAWDDSSGFKPIGTITTSFTGTYNGSGFIISNLNINRDTIYVGLFGYTLEEALLDSITMTNAQITNIQSTTGALVGFNRGTISNCSIAGTVNSSGLSTGGVAGFNYSGYNGNASINNCSFSGVVNSDKYSGGLVGENSGNISNSTASVIVNADNNSGGLVGRNYGSIDSSSSSGSVMGTERYPSSLGGLVGTNRDSGVITNSFSSSNVVGNVTIGGLVGVNFGAISKSYANGTLTIGYGRAGGLVGRSYKGTISKSFASISINGNSFLGGLVGQITEGDITESYATGDITGNSFAGGLVGYSESGTFISNSYATGNVIAGRIAGGLVGGNSSTIQNSFSMGAVSSGTETGGFIGKSYAGGISGSYWNTKTSGQSVGIGVNDNSHTVTGVTSVMMMQDNSFTTWNFDSVWVRQNYTYPTLQSNQEQNPSLTSNNFIPSGSGSGGNPYQISTVENLFWLSENVSAWDNHIIQTADIDASETAAWNDSLGFSPIGTNNSARFQGEYDGDGYTISGLTIRRENQDNVGLFGYVNNFGKVENVGLIDANITGRSNAGGLIGQSINATVTNSFSTGKVTSSSFRVGGLIGYANSTTITGTYSKASVQSDRGSNIGGLIGELDNSTLSQSYATGDVSGGARVGGLIGTSPTNVITDSYATGNVQSSSFYAGGLIGGFGTQFTTEDSLKNSYSTGTVSGSSAGGLIGQNRGTVLGSYWDTESSGLNDGIGEDYNSQSVTGLTSQQMVQQNSFADFDFESVWSIESYFTTPYITSNKPDSINGYDYSTFVIGGSGTEADPYQMGSLANIHWLTQNDSEWDKHYKQMVDIDFSESSIWNDGSGFSPIGNATTRFTGSFDGNGYSISNLTVKNDTSGYIGFFGNARNAKFSNISIKNADIIGGGSYVGVLLGFGNIVTANNIEVDGTVSGKNQAGGLAGTIWTGTISRIKSSVDVTSTESGQIGGIIGAASSVQLSESFSTGIITGVSNYTGGLIGYTSQFTTIEKSFTSGSVNGTGLVGGLVGGNTYNSSISNSYSIAKVNGNSRTGAITGYNNGNSTVSGTYWNSEKSGLAVGIDYDDNAQSSTSLTIEELKNPNKFSNWDFDNTWVRPNGSVLPTLQWSDYRLAGPEIKGSQGWRMFGAPFVNATFGSITDSLWTQGIAGGSTSRGRPNIFTWNESTQSWGVPDSLSSSLPLGKGFMMYVFEDDKYQEEGTQGGFPKSIIAEGKASPLPQTIPLSYTDGALSNLNGINFVSNPSLSTLNWEEISKTNTTGIYYVWDGANSHYDAYQTGVGGTNSATKYIAPFQGFYVKATGTSAELNIDSTAIASTDTIAYKSNINTEIFSVLLHLENKNGLSDELRMVIREEALAEYDDFDAPEFGSLASSFLNISSRVDSIDLVIDSRPLTETLSFDLVFDAQNTSGQALLSIAENKLPENWTIELVNTVTDDRFDLTKEEVSLSISETNAKPSFEPKQLRTKSSGKKPIWKVVINTTGIATSTEDEASLPDKFSLSQNYPNPFNPTTTIKYDLPIASVVKLTVFDILGRKVATLVNERKEAGYHQIIFNAQAMASGVYLYRLEAGNNIFIKKLTLIK